MASVLADKLEADAQEYFRRADAAERYGKRDCAAHARAIGHELGQIAEARRVLSGISDGRRNPR